MSLLKRFSKSIYAWLLAGSGFLFGLQTWLSHLGQKGALNDEAWFIHAVTDTVVQLSQQRTAVVTGACRTREGVKGKTDPWNLIGSQDMALITTRDATTQYANPPQTKRRAILLDFGQAVLIDDFDELKMLANPKSELAQILGYSLERKKDDLCLGVAGLASAGASGAAVGGFIGMATAVNEAAETTTSTDLPAGQQIVNGASNLTMAKVRSTKQIMDLADVLMDDRYLFYSPIGMQKLMTDNTVTSADYNTINAINSGQFPRDATFYGFKWRMSNKLPKSGNIRSCIAVQAGGVAYSVGVVQQVQMSKNPERWNNDQAIIKLSAGTVRVDDTCVVQIDIDETA